MGHSEEHEPVTAIYSWWLAAPLHTPGIGHAKVQARRGLTTQTIERLRHRRGSAVEEWVRQVSKTLGIEGDVDTKALLDVARVAAHKVERRAAPVTTYLMGVAIAQGDADRSLEDLAKDVIALARAWEAEGGSC
jgi:hypothetical protein